MFLTGILFHRDIGPVAHTPPNHGRVPGGCHGPPRFWLVLVPGFKMRLRKNGYFGGAQGCDPTLTSAIKNIIEVIFVEAFCRLKATVGMVVFLLFWHRQKAGFEAHERSKDASHAPTHNSQIDHG